MPVAARGAIALVGLTAGFAAACSDITAENYDGLLAGSPGAADCIYSPILVCTDSTATNYVGARGAHAA